MDSYIRDVLGWVSKQSATEAARHEAERKGWEWTSPVVSRSLLACTVWPSGRGQGGPWVGRWIKVSARSGQVVDTGVASR